MHYGQQQQPYSATSQQGGEWNNFDDREEQEEVYDDEGKYMHPGMIQHPYNTSGRGTPIGAANGRRGAMGISMPPERDTAPGFDEQRAKTGDAATFSQWRQQAAGLPPTPSSQRPPMVSRNISAASGVSMSTIQTDSSFGNGTQSRPTMLRSQFSSSRLRAAYNDDGRYDEEPQMRQTNGAARTRAVSNPTSSYPLQQSRPPPVPIAPQWTGSSQSSSSGAADRARIATGQCYERIGGSNGRNQSSLGLRRPLSGGSSDTEESSGHSPDGQGGLHQSTRTLRGTRSQVFNGHSRAGPPNPYAQNSHTPAYGNPVPNGMPGGDTDPPVKIKVYWLQDLFVIMVPRTTSFTELMQRVQKKIRLCGGGNTDGPLRLRYDDEDGDRISLSTDEELQMAFDMSLSRTNGQGQLTLRVS